MSPVQKSLALAGVIVLSWVGGFRTHAADRNDMMARVERALVAAGYGKAQGYSLLPPPAIEVNEIVDGGGWGSYRLGRVEISSRQPVGCIPITMAHELSHDAAARMGLLDGVPINQIMAELDRIARVAEAAIDADDYAPNCTLKRLPL